MFLYFIFYNFCKMKWYEAQLIISNDHLFSPFSICTSAVSLFLASLCLSIYGAAFERMFTSRCLCAIIRQSRITHSLHRFPPLRFFVFLNRICSHMFYCFQVQRNSLGSIAFSLHCCMQNAELSPFSSYAKEQGQGPY